jgi:hypothetical protein
MPVTRERGQITQLSQSDHCNKLSLLAAAINIIGPYTIWRAGAYLRALVGRMGGGYKPRGFATLLYQQRTI